MSPVDMLPALCHIVGEAHVLSGQDLSAFEVDWRQRYRGKALAVARPATAAELAAVIRLCARHGVSVVAQGGNTSTVGGAVPDDSGRQLLLSLQRLNRLRQLDAANLTLTAEAGCILQSVQQTAGQAGLLFPLSLASEGSCTIGGNLATNAGGTQVLRYGNARELCLGLEVVTAQGEIWSSLSGLRKDNAGYDLRDIFIGSEGTLGVITAATLRLFPQPSTVVTALLSCDSLAACVAVLQQVQTAMGPELTGFEVMNRTAIELVREQRPDLSASAAALGPSPAWTVLIEIASGYDAPTVQSHVEHTLHALLVEQRVQQVSIAQQQAQAQAMWQLREAIPLAQARAGLNVKHDIALPVSAWPAFVARTDAAVAQRWPGASLVTFGHLGDGNLHYNVQAPRGSDAARFLQDHEAALNALVFDAVEALGGSIAAEHGIGQLRRDELARRKPPVELAMMRALKQALDPAGLLNPGRVL